MSVSPENGKSGSVRSPEEVLRQARIAHSTRMASMALINRVSDKHSTTRQRRTSLVRLQFDSDPFKALPSDGSTLDYLSPGYGEMFDISDNGRHPDGESISGGAATSAFASNAATVLFEPNECCDAAAAAEAGIIIGERRSSSSSGHGDDACWEAEASSALPVYDTPSNSITTKAPPAYSLLAADGSKPLLPSSSLPDAVFFPNAPSSTPLPAWPDGPPATHRPSAGWNLGEATPAAATPRTLPRTSGEAWPPGAPTALPHPPSPTLLASSAAPRRRNMRLSSPSGLMQGAPPSAPLPLLRVALTGTADGRELSPPALHSRSSTQGGGVPMSPPLMMPRPQSPAPLLQPFASCEQPPPPPPSNGPLPLQLPAEPPQPLQLPQALSPSSCPSTSPQAHAAAAAAAAGSAAAAAAPPLPSPRFRDRVYTVATANAPAAPPSPVLASQGSAAAAPAPGPPGPGSGAWRLAAHDREHTRYPALAAAVAAGMAASAASSAPLPGVTGAAAAAAAAAGISGPRTSCCGGVPVPPAGAAAAACGKAHHADEAPHAARVTTPAPVNAGLNARLRGASPASARSARSGPLLRPSSRGLNPSSTAVSGAAAAGAAAVPLGSSPGATPASPVTVVTGPLAAGFRGQGGLQPQQHGAKPLGQAAAGAQAAAAAAAAAAVAERPGSAARVRWGPGTCAAMYAGGGGGGGGTRLRGSDAGYYCHSATGTADGSGAETAQDSLEQEQEQAREHAPAHPSAPQPHATLMPRSRAASPALLATPFLSASGHPSVVTAAGVATREAAAAGRALPAQPLSVELPVGSPLNVGSPMSSVISASALGQQQQQHQQQQRRGGGGNESPGRPVQSARRLFAFAL